MITYASVCSGIEAASVAWEPLGWKPLWFSEIDKFPCELLEHYYPDTPNLGDMTKITNPPTPTVFCGGTPCQSFSTAGQRGGMKDARGQLSLDFIRLANETNAPVILWENVVGCLSSGGGEDFKRFVSELSGAKCVAGWPAKSPGYGVLRGPKRTVAWRVLDAQYFGVPQRRRRVYVVASGGAVCPAEVLFERTGLSRDTEPSEPEAKGTPARVDGCTAKWCDVYNLGTRNHPSYTVTTCTGQSTASGPKLIVDGYVRRITPLEAERLQGFPDNYTAIDNAKDTPRYKAIGNSWPIPVIRWIGKRIERELCKNK